MEKIGKKERAKKLFPFIFKFGLFLFLLVVIIFSQKASAATVPSMITYQGKLLISGRLATTTQSMQFTLYDSLSGGTALYTASGTIATPQSISVTPSQGLFSINLGDTGTNGLSSAVFQNNGSVFLEVKVGSDILTPRKQITAVPYAFNAAYLDGVGVNTISSTTYIPKSDSNGNFIFNSTTVNTSTISNLFTGSVTSTNLNVSGPLTFASATGTNMSLVRLNSASDSSALTIGSAQGTGLITVGNSSVAQTLSLGVGNSSTVNIGTGSGAVAINIGTGASAGGIQIGGTNVSTTILGGLTISGIGATTTNLFVSGISNLGNITFSNANGTSITTTNSNISSLLSFANATGTSVSSTNLFTTNLAFNNANGTSVTTTNLFVSGSNNLITTGLAGQFPYYASNGFSLTPTSGIFILPNGSIGINSTSPNATLAIQQNDSVNSFVISSSTGDLISVLNNGNINIGADSSTGAINIGTSTSARTITIGNATGATSVQILGGTGAMDFGTNAVNHTVTVGSTASGANTTIQNGTGALTLSTAATANGVIVTANNEISGFAESINSTATALSSGGMLRVNKTGASGSTAYTGDIVSLNYTQTFNGGVGLVHTGNLIHAIRSTTLNAAQTQAITGALAIFSDNATQAAGTLNSSADVIQVSQNYAANTGTALNITTAGSGLALRVNDDGTLTDASPFVIDSSGRVGIGTSTPQATFTLQGNGTANPFSIVSSTAAASTMLTVLTNGNVGVNTSSPFATFSVQGDLGVTAGIFDSNGTRGTNGQLLQTNGTVVTWVSTSSLGFPAGNGTVTSGLAGQSTFYAANGTTVVGTSTLFFTALQRIGIGTTTPQSKVTIEGTGGENPFSIVSSSPAAASLLSVLTNGNVGIGSSTPSTKLVVDGSISITSGGLINGLGAAKIDIGSAITNGVLVTATGGLYINTNGGIIGNNLGSFFLDAFKSTADTLITLQNSDASKIADVMVEGSLLVGTSTRQALLNIFSTATNTPSLEISSSTGASMLRMTAGGRLGINSSSPNSALSVMAVSGDNLLDIASSTGASMFTILANGNIGINSSSPNASLAIQVNNGINPFDISSSTGSSIFRVLSNGRVGINSTTPIDTLGVQGGLQVVGNASTTGFLNVATRLNVSAAVDNSNAQIHTRQDASGQEGIQVDNANAGGSALSAVDIRNGALAAGERLLLAAGGTAYNVTPSWQDAGIVAAGNLMSGGLVLNGFSKGIIFEAGGLGSSFQRMIISSSTGNVGIGTSTPIATLSVLASSTNGNNPIFEVASSSGTSLLRVLANGNIGINSSTPNSTLSITGNGNNLLSINSSSGASFLNVLSNGNIGINSSSPNFRLAVQGTSYFSQTSTFGGNISNLIDSNTVVSQISSAALLTGATPDSVFVSGRYAYTANSSLNTISVIDISNPSVPVEVASTSVGSSPRSIFVSGRYAYTVNGDGTLSVVDISNAAAPKQVATTTVGSVPVSIYISGRYAYVANNGASNISVVDISNPLVPKQIATTTVGAGPNSIFVSGRFAYTANLSANTISVIDISNPSAPRQTATTSVGGVPSSVYVSGRYAYVTNFSSNTLSVVDISNSSAPVQVATTSAGTSPNSVYVSGRYGYISNESGSGLSVIDVLNPLAPRNIANVSVGLNPSSIYVSGRYAYLSSADDTLAVVDISGTEVTSLIAHSAEVGNLQSRNDIFAQGNIMAGTGLTVGAGGIMSNGALSVFASSTDATSSILDISSAQTSNILKVFANGRVGIGTSSPTEKLTVVGNISNVIDRGTVISQVATVSVGANPAAIFVSGKYAYTANSDSSTISVIDISNPLAPVQIATTSVGLNPSSIFVSGRYAYTGNNSDFNISVIDISNPFAPRQVATSTTTFPISASSIFVSGRYAYIPHGDNSTGFFAIFDISNPLAPVKISSTSIDLDPRSVFVSGRFAYTANFTSNTISVIDVSNPSAPRQVATTSVGKAPHSIYVSGRYAYTANFSSNTISVVDISNPSAPLQVATTSVGGGPWSIYVSGRYAYVTNATSNTISIVDVNNPLAPVQIATTSVGSAPVSIQVSGRYAYISNQNSNNISIVDISGTEVTSLIAHSAEVGNLQSRNDIFAQGNIMAGTGLTVGPGGIMSQGTLSVFASSTGATSSIFDISSAASSSIFKVFANGRIGIGSSSPQFGFVVSSTVALPGLGAPAVTSDFVCARASDGQITHQTANCTVSSARFKENIQSLSQASLLAEVKALRSVSFDFKNGQVPDHGLNGGGRASSGFIAEEVAQIDPMLVVYTDSYSPEDLAFEQANYPTAIIVRDGKILIPQTVDYARVSVLLVGALQDLNSRLDNYASITDKLSSALTIDINNNNLTIGTSTNPFNLVVTGNLLFNNTNIINKLSFATSSLFESNVGGLPGARAFTFNAPNFSDTSADSYIISLRSNNTPVFSVAANGDVHAKGSYYGSNIVLGTSTNPGDLAERVDIAVDDTVEAGDVMVIDQNSPDTYRRSSSAYEQSVAGVISSNPTIIVGNGKTDYTAVMAMVGRVPVKVITENGNIKRGDLLITASTTGFAMKYDPAKDNNNKMVAVIGVALESLSSSTGKILALIRTGWIYNRDQAIGSLQNNVKQIALAEGINLDPASEPNNLNIENSNGQLAFVNGHLDLQNNSIINVASISGKNNRWRIDEWGSLIQKIVTNKGDKEIYGLQTSGKQEIVISGTSTLENGVRKVILTDLDQEIIDKNVPLKIQITMSGETKGVYVSERNFDSFVVKENENGTSNSSFDWTVIAKLLDPEANNSDSGQTDGGQGQQNSDLDSSLNSIATTTINSSTPSPEQPTTSTEQLNVNMPNPDNGSSASNPDQTANKTDSPVINSDNQTSSNQ